MKQNLLTGSHTSSNPEQRRNHDRTFHRPRKYKCKECHADFHKWSQVKNHCKDVHGVQLDNKQQKLYFNRKAL